MSARRSRRGAITRSLLVGLTLFALCGGVAVWRQQIYISHLRPYRPYLSANLIPGARSAPLVRTLALGYDTMASTFLWLRTIQDFGGQFRDPFALRSLTNAFWSMVTLDPLFTDAYDFGALVVADEGGSTNLWATRIGSDEVGGRLRQSVESIDEARENARLMLEEALRLFEYGIEHDPDHFRHAYNATYTCLMGFRTPARGIPYAEVATTRPDCPSWVAGTIPYLQGRSGEYRVALSLWFAQLRDSLSNQEPWFIGLRLTKIVEDGVNPWNMALLTDAMSLWSEMHGGALPDRVERLADEAFLIAEAEVLEAAIAAWREAHEEQTPPDVPTLIADGFLSPASADAPVFFDTPRFFIEWQILEETATPFAPIPEERFGLNRFLTVRGRIPDCPLGMWARFNSDTQLIEREQRLGGFHYMVDRRARRVVDSSRLFEDTARDLNGLRLGLDRWHGEHGGWPVSLDEMFGEAEQEPPLEPATGGPYAYDSATGAVGSTHFESLVVAPGEMVTSDDMGVARPLDENPL